MRRVHLTGVFVILVAILTAGRAGVQKVPIGGVILEAGLDEAVE